MGLLPKALSCPSLPLKRNHPRVLKLLRSDALHSLVVDVDLFLLG
jgi:hypothetical protein